MVDLNLGIALAFNMASSGATHKAARRRSARIRVHAEVGLTQHVRVPIRRLPIPEPEEGEELETVKFRRSLGKEPWARKGPTRAAQRPFAVDHPTREVVASFSDVLRAEQPSQACA